MSYEPTITFEEWNQEDLTGDECPDCGSLMVGGAGGELFCEQCHFGNSDSN